MDELSVVFADIIPFLRELVPPGLNLSGILRTLAYIAAVLVVVFIFKRIFPYAVTKISDSRLLKNHPLLAASAGADEDKRDKLVNLTRECIMLGMEIDRHTARPRNSFAVSRIVYAMLANEEPENRILASLCAMTCDAGYLDIRESLFQSEILSKRERTVLKTHVIRGIYHFDFVPPEYRDLFFTASTFHHENADGSGYAEGLGGDEIPYVARVIRIADTFVALTHKRSYRRTMSKKGALEEIKRYARQFDAGALSLLEKTVLKK